MRTPRSAPLRTRHSARFMLICILLGVVISTSNCEREPGILVNIATWPAGVERMRVRTIIEDVVGTDFFLEQKQSRFTVRLPPGSRGTVQLDVAALDAVDCKLATGMLRESVPENLSRFIERTLELSLLPAPVCIFPDSHSFDANVGPYSVVVGDFNGDLKPDLAVTNVSNSVSVLLGNGSGLFTAPIVTPIIPSGSTPIGLAVGDFNRDMKQDLVVADKTQPYVSVLLGDGKGGFSVAAYSSGGNGPYSVVVADFNDDAIPDIAVANSESHSVGVLLNKGAGEFPIGVPPTVSVGAFPYPLAAGDFNGDQIPDLLTASYLDNNVSVLLGRGQGVFSMAPPVAASMDAKGARAVAIGDFDGDMRQDLAVANSDGNSVSVHLGNGAGGFGPAKPAQFSSCTGPQTIAVGDFNRDAKLDLAVGCASANDVSVYLGNGLGAFGPAAKFPVGSVPTAIVVADLDGDKRPDLTVANAASRSVSVLLNRF